MSDIELIKYGLKLGSFNEFLTVGNQARNLAEEVLGKAAFRAILQQGKIAELSQSRVMGELHGGAFRRQQELSLAKTLSLVSSFDQAIVLNEWANNESFSSAEVAQKLFGVLGASRSIGNLLADVETPLHIQASLGGMERLSRFLGEFSFSSPEREADWELEVDGDAEAEDTLTEVESRIVRVNHLPLRVFNQIKDVPELIRGLSPREFEQFMADLLNELGFDSVQLTPRSGDGGRDVIATKHVNDIPVLMAFECKKYAEENKIGVDLMRSLLGTISHRETRASLGVLVTTSSFTSGAKDFIAAEASIDGKDFAALAKWVTDLRNE